LKNFEKCGRRGAGDLPPIQRAGGSKSFSRPLPRASSQIKNFSYSRRGPSRGGKDIPPTQRAGGRSRRAAAAHGTSDARRFLLGERSLSWTRLLVCFITLVQQVTIFLAARHPAQRAGGRLVFFKVRFNSISSITWLFLYESVTGSCFYFFYMHRKKRKKWKVDGAQYDKR
jgi:hypothetical protein